MLAGDLNASTGCVLDLVNTDDCAHMPGVNLPQQHNVRRRSNYDPQVNDHGKSLLDLCKTCDLRIVNGRTTGDTFGRITYHSPRGISTVDYFIVSHEMLNLMFHSKRTDNFFGSFSTHMRVKSPNTSFFQNYQSYKCKNL